MNLRSRFSSFLISVFNSETSVIFAAKPWLSSADQDKRRQGGGDTTMPDRQTDRRTNENTDCRTVRQTTISSLKNKKVGASIISLVLMIVPGIGLSEMSYDSHKASSDRSGFLTRTMKTKEKH